MRSKIFKNSPRRGSRGLRSLYALPVTLLALSGLAAEPAAAWFFDRQPPYRHHRYHRHIERDSDDKAGAKPKAADVKKPEGPLYAVVSLADQHVTFYDSNGQWAQGLTSTGVPGHETPTGVFTIMEKERWHHSNIYSGAPMPWMQRLAWTGVAMHEGAVHPGHTASHGCIRLQAEFAKRLFGVTSIGQRVIVSPQDVIPADIAHAHLPVAKFVTLPGEASLGETGSRDPAVANVALDKPAAKALNPLQVAQAMKAAAAAKAAWAVQARKPAQALLDSKSAEAHAAAREREQAEEALRRAQAELDEAARSAAKAEGEEAGKKAADRKAAAEAKLAAAEAKARGARDAEAIVDREIFAAQSTIRQADLAAMEVSAEAKQAARRLEPVSIFISRKLGRLYVRQATEHLFDVPVAIRDPERPIGTHLFIATKPSEDGSSLHWVSLTPPAAFEVKRRPHSSRRGRSFHAEEDAAPAPAFPETASAALDRIEIPHEAAERIAELLWTGATLIVSDVGMSGEGRFAMDFQVLQRTIVREE
jgi:hypothetical protein